MNKEKLIVATCLVMLLVTNQSFAQTSEQFYELPSHGMTELTTRMFSDHESISEGETFKLAIHFDLAFEWYTYTNENNDKNIPTTISLKLPDGFKVIKEEWPEPEIVPGRKGGVDKIYDSDFFVVYDIKATAKKGNHKILAELEWQVCDSSICMLGEASMETTVSVGITKKSALFPLINK